MNPWCWIRIHAWYPTVRNEHVYFYCLACGKQDKSEGIPLSKLEGAQ